MKIAAISNDRCLTVQLKGELDHHSAKGLMSRLEQEIEIALPLKMILDFKDVTFMDSSGIAVVIRMRQRMRELGGCLVLQKVNAQPRKVFEAAGISRLVEIE
ncbi:MAG: STAS domain-containing protein [Clostridiales bacterium]|nr:STAS domain-containing protein [Candidatus Cacconaster stercorequi]